ncbi:MAG: hypothetical protein JST73_01130 [Actinobacteria bacterium]|nr:hypothetical protein [Actinomycetota bacterium]
MASPAKLAAMAGSMAGGLLYIAFVCTIRIRNNSGETEFARADLVESQNVRRQSLYGAVLFGVVALIMLIVWAI